MAVLALFTLFTDTSLEVWAQSSLFVDLTLCIGLDLYDTLEK